MRRHTQHGGPDIFSPDIESRDIVGLAGEGADLVRWQTGAPAADPVGEYAAAAGRVLAGFAAIVALLGRRPDWPGERQRYR